MIQSSNDNSPDYIDERVHFNDSENSQAEDSQASKAQADEDDQNDILDGYMTYDMSEFHLALAENDDFDLDEDENDEDADDIENPDHKTVDQDVFSQNDFPSQKVTRSGKVSVAMNTIIQPNSQMFIQDIDPYHHEMRQVVTELEFHADNNYNKLATPVLEGDDIVPEVDMEMNPLGSPFNYNSEDDEDLNLFDLLEDNLDDNYDPYRVMTHQTVEVFKIDHDIYAKSSSIALKNSEVLSVNQEMDSFYPYLKGLGFQRELNILSIEDLINQDLLSNITAIEIQFENVFKFKRQMRDFQQKWLEVSPTFTFASQLQSFSLKLERFSEMIRFMLEYNAGKASGRRFQHGRTQFYFTDPQKVQQKHGIGEAQIHSSKRLTLNNTFQKDLQNVNAHQLGQDQSIESTQMCVALFKAEELHNQFLQFLHIRRASQKYSEIIGAFQRIRSRFVMSKLINGRQSDVKRQIKSVNYIAGVHEMPKKQHTTHQFFSFGFNHKYLRGLNYDFQTQATIIVENGYLRTDVLLYKAKIQASKYRHSSHVYQQFRTNIVDYQIVEQ